MVEAVWTPTVNGASRCQRTTKFAGARTRLLRVRPGARCVLRFSIIPETLLLHNRVNIFWGGLAASRSLWASAAAWSLNVPGCGRNPAIAQQDPPPDDQNKSKLQSLRSEGLGNTAASEIKLRREVLPGSLKAWSWTV